MNNTYHTIEEEIITSDNLLVIRDGLGSIVASEYHSEEFRNECRILVEKIDAFTTAEQNVAALLATFKEAEDQLIDLFAEWGQCAIREAILIELDQEVPCAIQ
jgi:hypothetical protein